MLTQYTDVSDGSLSKAAVAQGVLASSLVLGTAGAAVYGMVDFGIRWKKHRKEVNQNCVELPEACPGVKAKH